MSSAAESETQGMFSATQSTIPLRRILITLGHPQPPTLIKIGNLTSKGIITKLIKPPKSKSWDMRHHWIGDKITEKLINLIWRPASKNWADYFTKHHPITHHRIMRSKYLTKPATTSYQAHMIKTLSNTSV